MTAVQLPVAAPVDNGARVGAVVVSFHPDNAVLEQVIAALAPQVSVVQIVDNGSGAVTESLLRGLAAQHGAELICLGENCGIAAAHNVALRAAGERQLDYLLLLDHDSVPSADLVESLVQAHLQLQDEGRRVAAVGPRWVDARSGREGQFYRIRNGRIRGLRPEAQGRPVEVDFLISSGTLLYLPAVLKIGTMREDLFIDHVDTEWCLRARQGGWELHGVPRARISHALGDASRRIWLGRWREVAVHSPLRNYYEVRNTLLLLATPAMPWGWRIAQGIRALQVLVFYALCVPPRGRRAAAMLKALMHGLRGRGGKL